MRSIKAIFFGCAFIVIAILVLELAYIFLAVGYNALAESYPVLNDAAGLFRYVLGIPAFALIMFVGGNITAVVADYKARLTVVFHCVAVGIITVTGVVYPTLENASLTVTGVVIFVVSLFSTVAGGLYWVRMQQLKKLKGVGEN